MAEAQIRTRPRPRCPICGAAGRALYQGLRDRSFSAPAIWGFRSCPDPACGVAWLDPVPIEEDLEKVYGAYYTHQADALPLGPVQLLARDAFVEHRYGYRLTGAAGASRTVRKMADVLLRLAPGGRDTAANSVCFLPAPTHGGRLLEIGFGDGSQLLRMRSLGWEVEGVDVDPAVVNSARQRGLTVRHGTLADQSFPDAVFDAIYMSHVIEHVHEPGNLLRECARILKPSGKLVILTPNLTSWCHRRFGKSWFALDVPRHLVLFSPRVLIRLLEAAGLHVAKARTSARLTAMIWALSTEIRRDGRVSPFPPGRLIAAGIANQCLESALLRRQPLSGEEIVLVAEVSA